MNIKSHVKKIVGLSLKKYTETYLKAAHDRIDNIVAQAGTDNSEVVDARIDIKGVKHTTLNNRIVAEVKDGNEILQPIEGEFITIESLPGWVKHVEILGNTVQDPNNLADIKSVGDKVEGQDLYKIPLLSVGKNRSSGFKHGYGIDTNGVEYAGSNRSCTDFIRFDGGINYRVSNVGLLIVAFYDSSKKFISATNKVQHITPSNCKYIRYSIDSTVDYSNAQLEEGTVATPYEAYKSHELTILSPCQLEKVGTVADRIIERDGVWGVEKNIGNFKYTSTLNVVLHSISLSRVNCDTYYIEVDYDKNNIRKSFETSNAISNMFKSKTCAWELDESGLFGTHGTLNNIYINVPKGTVNIKEYIKDLNIKHLVQTKQFIPLPHDQQVKLRTFANKTNISSPTKNGVEPTFKGQVAKSKDAVINTHTEQIDNIHQELERVKKLEESTVSIVRNEGKDFVNVEATNQGYFDDVELKGKTLVSKYSVLDAMIESNRLRVNTDKSKINWGAGKYTIVNLTGKKVFADISKISDNGYVRSISFNALSVIELNQDEYIRCLFGNSTDGFELTQSLLDSFKKSFVILENDHAQNPPTQYFEGLASVGEGTDEIVVSSTWGEGNLFDDTNKIIGGYYSSSGAIAIHSNSFYSEEYIHVLSGMNIVGNHDKQSFQMQICEYDNNKTFIRRVNIDKGAIYTVPASIKFIRISLYDYGQDFKLMVNKGTTPKPYTPHKTDKKRLLRFNPTTQTWEKPILREWDIVEKKEGKYWNRERSGQYTFNGSENWFASTSGDLTCRFEVAIPGMSTTSNVMIQSICDKFNHSSDIGVDIEGMNCWGATRNVRFRINKSKLTSQDVSGWKALLKQWYDAGTPCKVVYQLAQEQVYECTSIDLITYPNETNLTINSGYITANLEAKYRGTIMDVVTSTQKGLSVLRNDFDAYRISQNALMLDTRYASDTTAFNYETSKASTKVTAVDERLYNLMLDVILVGKDSYDRLYMEDMIWFYYMDFRLTDDMFQQLLDIIEIQHNPVIEETPII